MNAPGKPWSGSRRSLKGVILGALLGTLTGGIGGACLGWALWNSPQQYYQMSGRSNLGGVLLENALALALAGLIVGALLGGMAGVLFEQWQRRCGPGANRTGSCQGIEGGLKLDGEAFNNKLNELGGQGWELVSVFDTNMGHGTTRDVVAVFKRPSR